jgi:hypothetical protein
MWNATLWAVSASPLQLPSRHPVRERLSAGIKKGGESYKNPFQLRVICLYY